ncbi:hypothetical protein AKJ65_07445 [candidate division MSBL1 archaeon SCGC-AAA259E19]|uniref:Uncharacterized protein n=1 Tax=candidate division MSBL1 archaeon SCGC-AAA259E19 TaxID=1698264 RepID=A0A133UE91_9EURY|nr:hypothetical protein AKJ65_07445 [candidate division MSBL1 archaeon SCGC-AAA259E19]
MKFKNTGETPTDFSISVDPPKPVFVKDNPSPVPLDPDEIASITVTLGTEVVEEDETGFGEVTVTATEKLRALLRVQEFRTPDL